VGKTATTYSKNNGDSGRTPANNYQTAHLQRSGRGEVRDLQQLRPTRDDGDFRWRKAAADNGARRRHACCDTSQRAVKKRRGGAGRNPEVSISIQSNHSVHSPRFRSSQFPPSFYAIRVPFFLCRLYPFHHLSDFTTGQPLSYQMSPRSEGEGAIRSSHSGVTIDILCSA
jgi:hypothetical protein